MQFSIRHDDLMIYPRAYSCQGFNQLAIPIGSKLLLALLLLWPCRFVGVLQLGSTLTQTTVAS